jgi:hypothetical protein
MLAALIVKRETYKHIIARGAENGKGDVTCTMHGGTSAVCWKYKGNCICTTLLCIGNYKEGTTTHCDSSISCTTSAFGDEPC